MSNVSRDFEARDLIAIMDEARNYNAFLTQQLAGWSRHYARILDFGAGNGRFARAPEPPGRRVRPP